MTDAVPVASTSLRDIWSQFRCREHELIAYDQQALHDLGRALQRHCNIEAHVSIIEAAIKGGIETYGHLSETAMSIALHDAIHNRLQAAGLL